MSSLQSLSLVQWHLTLHHLSLSLEGLLSKLWFCVSRGGFPLHTTILSQPSVFPYVPYYNIRQLSPTAATFETDVTLRSYGITLMTFPTFSPSLPLCVFMGWLQEKEGGLPPLPDAPALKTCGLGIIGLQLQQSNELALIWRMTPFTFVWLPAASTAAAFILHSGSGFYCIGLAYSQMSEWNTIRALIY